MAPRTTGRLVAVRLTDVPLNIRRRHGQALVDVVARSGVDPLEAMVFAAQVERAVEEPTDRIHWVPEDAARKVLG